ncbi:hypothetical protein AGOR_G00159730 [Albula goreensis]|uniref:Uncharacterized protein n=1 Tax=Albula goreensis TaxID=1534307 RepID=A0A8T3D8T0_9TELE|nr:hypothetical protein AGOR_G00159730 [Albula goreensis]
MQQSDSSGWDLGIGSDSPTDTVGRRSAAGFLFNQRSKGETLFRYLTPGDCGACLTLCGWDGRLTVTHLKDGWLHLT